VFLSLWGVAHGGAVARRHGVLPHAAELSGAAGPALRGRRRAIADGRLSAGNTPYGLTSCPPVLYQSMSMKVA
jgi:hypothetical protein